MYTLMNYGDTMRKNGLHRQSNSRSNLGQTSHPYICVCVCVCVCDKESRKEFYKEMVIGVH